MRGSARLRAICEQHGLALIEDCAQAIGADWEGKRCGGAGVAGCFSFYPSKNLGCYGDGGMVVTRDAKLAEEIRVLRNHGSRTRYHHHVIGYNCRLDEMQAAILRVKLKHLDKLNALRREKAHTYNRLLAGSSVVTPREHGKGMHVYHQYTLRSAKRDALKAALDAAQDRFDDLLPDPAAPPGRVPGDVPGRGPAPRRAGRRERGIAADVPDAHRRADPARVRRGEGAV